MKPAHLMLLFSSLCQETPSADSLRTQGRQAGCCSWVIEGSASLPSNRTWVRHSWRGQWSAKAAPQRSPQPDPPNWHHRSPSAPALITLLGGVPPTENLLEYLMLLCRAVKKHSFAIFTYYGVACVTMIDPSGWTNMLRFRVGVDFFHCKSFSGLIFLRNLYQVDFVTCLWDYR